MGTKYGFWRIQARCVLGLLFLKYVSDSFEELHAVLEKDECLDEEDHDEYFADTIFWVPKEAR